MSFCEYLSPHWYLNGNLISCGYAKFPHRSLISSVLRLLLLLLIQLLQGDQYLAYYLMHFIAKLIWNLIPYLTSVSAWYFCKKYPFYLSHPVLLPFQIFNPFRLDSCSSSSFPLPPLLHFYYKLSRQFLSKRTSRNLSRIQLEFD